MCKAILLRLTLTFLGAPIGLLLGLVITGCFLNIPVDVNFLVTLWVGIPIVATTCIGIVEYVVRHKQFI